MARQEINLGTAPTGAGGDTTRSTGVKINAMTTELYSRTNNMKSAAYSDLVGSVAQSGGIPTGDVIQRGTNANGEFVRFADGTQFCWATTTATVAVNLGPASGLYYGTTSWTYPAQFSSAPIPRCSASSGGVLTFEIPASTSTTAAAVAIGAVASIASRSYNLSMFAVGRWY